MAIQVPSQDQVAAQLRILIPAIGIIVSAFGIMSADKVGNTQAAILTSVGPISYIITSIWSFVANTRGSIMASAAKPVSPDVPPPQIILPREEAKLAASLPSNVTSK